MLLPHCRHRSKCSDRSHSALQVFYLPICYSVLNFRSNRWLIEFSDHFRCRFPWWNDGETKCSSVDFQLSVAARCYCLHNCLWPVISDRNVQSDNQRVSNLFHIDTVWLEYLYWLALPSHHHPHLRRHFDSVDVSKNSSLSRSSNHNWSIGFVAAQWRAQIDWLVWTFCMFHSRPAWFSPHSMNCGAPGWSSYILDRDCFDPIANYTPTKYWFWFSEMAKDIGTVMIWYQKIGIWIWFEKRKVTSSLHFKQRWTHVCFVPNKRLMSVSSSRPSSAVPSTFSFASAFGVD